MKFKIVVYLSNKILYFNIDEEEYDNILIKYYNFPIFILNIYN